MTRFLAELRRRNVFRVAAAYLVVGWLVMQVVATIGAAAGMPDWTDSFALILLVTGFPIVLFIAWAFELTPEGLKKTDDDANKEPRRALGSTDFVLIGLLVLVLAVIGYQTLMGGGAGSSPQIATGPETAETTAILDAETDADPVVDASIAVMPFADLSPEGDQQYFSDGIAEELLNALAQFSGLRVAARTSAFSFRGDEVDLRTVGEALDVAHVLEGSVRRSGERLRITAQLIRVSDGFHLWSQTYERDSTDIFEIQDDIVRELSRVLQVRLGVGGGVGRAGSAGVDPQAYEQYLRGLSLWNDRVTGENRRAAIRAFARATEIDPGFAEGWASYGLSLVRSSPREYGLSLGEYNELIRQSLEHALTIDPDNARAHTAMAAYFSEIELDIERATEHAYRAYELAPGAAFTSYGLGLTLIITGDHREAIRAFERARSIDSLNSLVDVYLAVNNAMLGQIPQTRAALDACAACPALDPTYYMLSAAIQGGSDAELRTALSELIEWDAQHGEQTPEGIAEHAYTVAVMTDYVDRLLGDESKGGLVLSEGIITPETADVQDASFLALMGDDEAALDALERLAGEEAFYPELIWILNGGRFELPERTRRNPRYHALWALPGMQELAAVRRANGQTGGLPLRIESDE